MKGVSRFRPRYRWRGSVWGLVGLLLAWSMPALAQTELAEPPSPTEPAKIMEEEAMLLGGDSLRLWRGEVRAEN